MIKSSTTTYEQFRSICFGNDYARALNYAKVDTAEFVAEQVAYLSDNLWGLPADLLADYSARITAELDAARTAPPEPLPAHIADAFAKMTPAERAESDEFFMRRKTPMADPIIDTTKSVRERVWQAVEAIRHDQIQEQHRMTAEFNRRRALGESAQAAGIAWAEREAEALMVPPKGHWLSSTSDALALVDGDRDLAAIANGAARQRWEELVEEASA